MRHAASARSFRFPAALAALAALNACGGTPQASGVTNPPPTISSIKFSSADTLFLTEGDSAQLDPKAYDSRGQVVSATFSFAMASGASATVNQQGVLVAVGPGVSVASASAGGQTATRAIAIYGHPASYAQRRVPLGLRPYGLAVTANGAVFVTQLDGRTVTRFSLPALARTAQVSVGDTPTGISADSQGVERAVTNQFDPSVGLIDAGRNSEVATVTSPATTFRTLFAHDGSRVYGTSSNGALLVIDATNHTLVGSLGIPQAANGLAWSPDDKTLYVSSMFGTLVAVDITSGLTIRTVNVGTSLQDVAATADGKTLYVADEGGDAVDVFALPALTATGQIHLQYGAFGLSLSPDGQRLYVTEPMGARVTVIDVAKGAVVQDIDLTGGTAVPRRVAFDRFGTMALVTDESGAVWALGSTTGS